MNTAQMAEQRLESALQTILQPLCFHPNDISFRRVSLQNETTVLLKLHADDRSHLDSIQDIRLSLDRIALEISFRAGRTLKLVHSASTVGEIEDSRKFKSTHSWQESKFIEIANELCSKLFAQFETSVEDLGELAVCRISLVGKMPDHAQRKLEKSLGVIFTAIGQTLGRDRVMVEIKVETFVMP